MFRERLESVEKRISEDVSSIVKRASRNAPPNVSPYILILCHNDMDGVTGSIIFEKLFEYAKYGKGAKLSYGTRIKVEICDTDANDILNIIENSKEYIDRSDWLFKKEPINVVPVTDVIIYDLSINDIIREEIEIKLKDENDPLKTCILIDHHASNNSPNLKDWEYVLPHDETKLTTCKTATELFYNLVCVPFYQGIFFEDEQKTYKKCRQLVKLVSIYDSWAWKNKWFNTNVYNFAVSDRFDYIYGYNREEETKLYESKGLTTLSQSAKILNSFFKAVSLDTYKYQINKWLDHKQNCLISGEISLVNEINTQTEFELCEICSNNYMKKTLMNKDGRYHTVALCFADKYQSEIGNYVCEQNKDIDICLMISNANTVSMRTIKDNINLVEIAKVFGGGGHPQAAGFPITDKLKIYLIITNIIDLKLDV